MSSERSRPSPRSISRAEQFEHAAGAGAEIEQRAERLVGERGADGAFDRRVGDVQLADAVPFGGVGAEIGLRGGGARLPAPRRAAPGRARWSGRRDRAGRAARGRPRRRRRCSASRKKAQVPSRKRSTRPGLGQQLEMARDARLRLAQNVGEVGDGELGLGQQRQHAQARLLAGRLERGVEGIETEAAVRGSCAVSSDLTAGPWAGSHHIKISLYVETAARKPPRVAMRGFNAGWFTGYARASLGAPMTTKDFGIREGEKAVELPAKPDAGALFHRPHPHALEGAQGLPQERPRIRGGLHHRGRPAPSPTGLKDVETCSAPGGALLDGQGAAQSGAAGARPLRRPARHLCPALAGPPQPGRHERGEAAARRGQHSSPSSASTASTARRSSTSSPISPPPTACRTRWSAGTSSKD